MDREQVDIYGKKYIAIEDKYLEKGMYCSSDVYYIREDKPILMCAKSIINQRFIEKMKFLRGMGMALYVDEEAYKSLKEQYEYLHEADEKNEKRLLETRERFNSILNQARVNTQIDMSNVAPLVDNIAATVKEVDMSFILYWTSYMRSMDEYLQTHSTNVAMLNGKIATWLGLEKNQVEKAITIGLLHDLGKEGIPYDVLNKPGRLTDEEFEIIKKHPVISWTILKKSGVTDDEILSGVRGHHEKNNGSGYPDGLKLEDISIYSRMTAIADIYDAMVAERVYKSSKTPFEVLDEFFKEKYAELDMSMVDLFLDHMRSELVGKKVILSDGRVATISYIEDGKFLNPIVNLENEILPLNDSLQCVSLCTKTGIL